MPRNERPAAEAAALKGGGAGDHRDRAGAGHLHAGAGHHHRQCLAADHRRQSRRLTDQGTWVITSFAVANGIGVPLTGWLMGRYRRGADLRLSVLAFTVASFLCGIAWSLPSLIFFRVLQGAVSGPMIPGSQALLISIFPSDKRATALGIWSITTLVAPICGPILGGYISDNYPGAGSS
jgi:MFS family permease